MIRQYQGISPKGDLLLLQRLAGILEYMSILPVKEVEWQKFYRE